MGRDAIGRTEAQVIGTSPIERTALEREEELFTINMGPHHPATHGVLRLLVSLEGEVVRDLKPVMGYVHTGIEKSCEHKSYWKVIPFIERMDYLSYFFNMEAFCGATEKLLELEIPPRAAVPADPPPGAEPDPLPPRRARHDRARPRRDLDVLVLLPRARQDPRPVRDVVGPAHAHALLPGRRRRSRTSRSASPSGSSRSAPTCRGGSTSTSTCSTRTRSSCSGRRTSASSSRERLLELGVTGPLLRAAGEPWDLRKVEPATCRTRTSTSTSRSGPSATTTTAIASASTRCASRCGSSSRRSTGCPRARGSPTTARSCCRRATSSAPRWRR